MSILQFDKNALIAQLEQLPNQLRAAFAAACAERQLPNYFRFSEATGEGNPERLEAALRRVWDDIEGRRPAGSTELKDCLDACMSLLPNEDLGNGDLCLLGYFAEDAVAAVAYAIETRLKSDPCEAVESAHRAYSALDEYVSHILKIRSIGQKEETQILTHPLVQAEFKRQRTDLLRLQEIAKNPSSEREGIAEVRRRSEVDARSFFGPEPK
jgi:uncharacterized protein YjaG (DUF416 family)